MKSVIAVILLFGVMQSALADGGPQVYEQDHLNFYVSKNGASERKAKFSLKVLSTDSFKNSNSSYKTFDTLGIRYKSGIKVVLSKTVITVDKPISFFTKENIQNERFNERTLRNATVQKVNSNTYRVDVDDIFNYSYKLKVTFLSTSKESVNSSSGSLVSKLKSLDKFSDKDVIIKRESFDFDGISKGSVIVSRHIPVSKSKTMIVSYAVLGLKSFYTARSIMESNLKKSLKNLIKQYGNL